jgi:hypothetical protein
VEYVVIDRDMLEKVASAGWRLERPDNLLDTHARIFEANLERILAGDGLPNVQVAVPEMDGRNCVARRLPVQASDQVRSAA